MDTKYTREEKKQRVNEVIAQFGLLKCQDTVIGIPGRIPGISGGEKKRLSFASEIITNPKLLFVDEPTSGLDSYMAESCVMELQKLANEGRTIIVTIHQPSSGVFQLFDRIILLSEGRTAFQGSTKDAVEFFNECGYPTPSNFNPADHYIRTLAIIPGNESECKKRSETICDTYAASRFAMGKGSLEDEEGESEVIDNPRYHQGFCTQTCMVLWRASKQFRREPFVSNVKLVQTIITSLVLGLIFLQQPNDQDGVVNLNGLLFFLIIILSFSNALSVIMVFPLELPVFLKENKLNMYSVGAYFIGRQMAELPWYLLNISIQAIITYWMAGLAAEFTKFIIFFGIVHLTAQCGLSYGMVISAAAPTPYVAQAIGGPSMLPLFIFGGYFIKAGSIPVYFVWLKIFSWIKYSFELTLINQWNGFGDIGCRNTTAACLPDGQTVLRMNGYHPDNFSTSIGCLLALIVGFRLVAFLLILLRTYRNK